MEDANDLNIRRGPGHVPSHRPEAMKQTPRGTSKRERGNRVSKRIRKKTLKVRFQEEEQQLGMASDGDSPKRETTPTAASLSSSISTKRVLDDDHVPAISSPLNPDVKPAKQDDAPLARERAARAKKESYKKRESKGGAHTHDSSSRATPEPKSKKKVENRAALEPIRYPHLGPRPRDFEPPQGPSFQPSHTIKHPDGGEIQFNETSEHVNSKKGFHYTHCIADPAFKSSVYYRQSETEPYNARFSFEHISSHMMLDRHAKHVTTDKGWRMAKANVCAREGRWYWECKITSGIKRKGSDATVQNSGHVRMGWARREATLDAPVGFDAYSYGFRDVDGQKCHLSRPLNFFPPGESMEEDDVIGLEINLPSEELHRKILSGDFNPKTDLPSRPSSSIEHPNIIRDRLPIRFKSHLYFEHVDYTPSKELEDLLHPSANITPSNSSANATHTGPNPKHSLPALRTLPESSIKIYKNGVLMGTAFADLLSFLPLASRPQSSQLGAREGADDGMLGYYPAVSVFRGGAAEVNFGPDFWFPPPDLTAQDEEVDMVGSDHPASTVNHLKRLRAMSERYDEQIVEDIVYDIVDEVDFWMMDGGKTDTEVGDADILRTEAAGAAEIKTIEQEE